MDSSEYRSRPVRSIEHSFITPEHEGLIFGETAPSVLRLVSPLGPLCLDARNVDIGIVQETCKFKGASGKSRAKHPKPK
jgi:hypothetical protein